MCGCYKNCSVLKQRDCNNRTMSHNHAQSVILTFSFPLFLTVTYAPRHKMSHRFKAPRAVHLELNSALLVQMLRRTQNNSSLNPHMIPTFTTSIDVFVSLYDGPRQKCCARTCSAWHLYGCLGLYRARALTNIYTVTEPSLLPEAYFCLLSDCVTIFHTHLYKLDTHQKSVSKQSINTANRIRCSRT